MVKGIIRTFSFFGKWVAEIMRQPVLVLVLVIGPFFVLLAFGLGISTLEPPPRTLLVTPGQGIEIQQAISAQLGGYLNIVGTVSDIGEAREQVRHGNVDIAVTLPPDPIQSVKRGEHVELTVITNEIDPLQSAKVGVFLNAQVASLNQAAVQSVVKTVQERAGAVEELLMRAKEHISAIRSAQDDIQEVRMHLQEIEDIAGPLTNASALLAAGQQEGLPLAPGSSYLFDRGARLSEEVGELMGSLEQLDAKLSNSQGGSVEGFTEELDRIEANIAEIESILAQVRAIPPEVLSAPFQYEIENVASYVPSFVNFYAPAVLSLLLQHLAITLGGLSLSRIRLLGIVELLRIAPVRASEVVLGNYLSYGVLCALVGVLLVTLLVFLLGVPVLGSYTMFAATLSLLVVSALGIGYVVAAVSSSEHQAAQIAMLVLLASIFFSGFVVDLERVLWPVRAVSYMLPTTYAIRTLQDVMLRGVMQTPTDLLVLSGFCILFFAGALFLFRREFRPS